MLSILKIAFCFFSNFISQNVYIIFKKVRRSFKVTMPVVLATTLFIPILVNAQDVYKDQRSGWLQKAESTTPKLIETVKAPVSLVTLVKDENMFQRWKAVKSDPVDTLYSKSFNKQSGVVVDFGEHLFSPRVSPLFPDVSDSFVRGVVAPAVLRR
jgi:hypothetical protein